MNIRDVDCRERLEAYLYGLALGCLVMGILGGIMFARVAGWGHQP